MMLTRWGQLNQTLIEISSLPKRELDLGHLNQLLEDSNLVLSYLLLVLLVDIC